MMPPKASGATMTVPATARMATAVLIRPDPAGAGCRVRHRIWVSDGVDGPREGVRRRGSLVGGASASPRVSRPTPLGATIAWPAGCRLAAMPTISAGVSAPEKVFEIQYQVWFCQKPTYRSTEPSWKRS